MALSAETIGQAAQHDQQLTAPAYPVVRRGAAVKPYEGGKLIVGVVKPQVLSGRFATQQLDALLNLCDGTRSHAQLATELALPVDAVFKAVVFLWTCGLLEDAAHAVNTEPAGAELATMLSRLGDSTGVRLHWSTAAAALESTTVCLVGEPQIRQQLGALIAATGVRVVEHLEKSEGTENTVADLLVVATTGGNDQELTRAAATAWERGIPLVRVQLGRHRVQVGPYVDPAFTPCLECGIASQPDEAETAPDAARAPGEHNTPGPGSTASTHLGLGLAAHQITALISRSFCSHLPGDTQVTDLYTLETRTYAPTTRAGCPQCGCAAGKISPSPSTAARYEQSVAIPPRQFVDVKGHQAHYKPSNVKLQHEFRDFYSAPSVPLPPPNPHLLDTAGTGAEPGLSLEALSLVLSYSAGLRPRTENSTVLRRWTAAGGNLGSVGVRVVITDPRILPPGTYAYIESNHTLRRLNTETPETAAPATLILLADVYKVAQKYGTFALRVCLQDAGCSLVTARLVCEQLGIQWQPVPRWDEHALAAACDAKAENEPITAVVHLGGTNA